MRGFDRRRDRSTVPAALKGQCCPFLKAADESFALALAQLPHGLRKPWPEEISQSVGSKATNVIFTRSIAPQLCHAA